MKWRRFFAIFGLVIILAMYLIALISAFSHSPESKNWLMAALYSSVIIPVFLYAGGIAYRVIKPGEDNGHKDGPTHND